jgi:uncharacterized membrane protein YdjX (TVP38/TMEM64 family)
MSFEEIRLLIESHESIAPILLIVGKLIGAVLLFPGTPLTLLAGGILGTFWGTVVSVIGNILGAIVAFFIARHFLRKFVTEKFVSRYPKLATYEERFFKDGIRTVLFLRLIPIFPFNILNYALGVTRVSAKDYIIGTSIGIIPGTLAYTYFGESIAMLSPLNIGLAIAAIIGLTYIGKKYERK